MKSPVTALFMILLSAVGSFAVPPIRAGAVPPSPAEVSAAAVFLDDLNRFEETFPRAEGSTGERAAFEYLESRIRSMGIGAIRWIAMDRGEDVHSFSRSLDVRLPGALNDTLIIAVPVNSSPDGSSGRDGSINLALALAIAEHARHAALPVSLQFLFLGAEYGSGEEYPLGTELFLRDFFPEAPVAILYLDFRGAPARILVESGGRGIVTPSWLLARSTAAMDTTGLPFLNLGSRHQIFRLGVSSTGTAVERFLQAGYPAISLRDAPGSSSSPQPERWAAGFLTFFDDFLRRNTNGFNEEWDRHYLFYQSRSRYVMIGERTYIMIVILVLASTLAYGIIFKSRLVRYLRTISRNAWNLPVFLGLVFGFLFLATLLLRGVFLIRSFPSLWEASPLLFFGLKITAALFLFSLFFQIIRRLPFSRNGSFYSASALLFLFIDIAILTVFNISFSYYFLWAFFFAFLFSSFRHRWLKILSLAAAPVWLLKATVDIFTLPDLPVSRILLLSPVRGNLLLAFFTLPFLLMLIRIDFLIRHPIRGRRGFTMLLSASFTGIVTAALAVSVFLLDPYDAGELQPLEIIETVDQDAKVRSLRIDSPAPLGDLTVRYGGKEYPVAGAQRSWTAPDTETGEEIDFRVQETPFLNRKTITLTVDSPEGSSIRSVEVELFSPDRIVVYDATFPVSLDPAAGSARIHIGTNPPIPLAVQFTVPGDIRMQARIRTFSDCIRTPFAIEGKTFAPVFRQRVIRTLPLR